MTLPTRPGVTVDILDVGHGSCVVVRSGEAVALIDAGPGGAILEYLRAEGISRIDAILVSHADADHIGGVSAILSQGMEVAQFIWNGDSMKQSSLWKDLVYQLADLQRNGRTWAQQNAFDGLRVQIGSSRVEVAVLAPGLVLRQLGAGSSLLDGRAITSNTVSVVAQVVVDGEPLLLVPGDLDAVGYDELIQSVAEGALSSKYLILPHHGGLLGPRDEISAATITSLVSTVRPDIVFVSNGRGKFGNPRRAIVDAARKGISGVPISCTQLSKSCAVRDVDQGPASGPYSRGWARGHSCQGSTRITLGDGIDAPLDRSRHIAFLGSSVPQRVCG